MKALPFMLLTVPALLLAGCGGDDSSSTQTSNVSFAVSDAPVDDAISVTIAFTEVELIDSEGNSTTYPVNSDGDYQQINLLDYQGTDSELIVTQTPIPVGTYKNLILHVSSDSDVNFVVDDLGTQELKQPSNKLKLGGFEVLDSEEGQQFTIEFDLRQSLVMRGNSGSQNGYILKPHGVTIVDNQDAASLSGTVDSNWFDEGTCSTKSSNFVYLYKGQVTDETLLDLFDPDVNTATLPEPYLAPYASTEVADDGAYSFGYLPSGTYTVAFACSDAEDDDAEQYDQLDIPQPSELIDEITLESGENGIVNFPYN